MTTVSDATKSRLARLIHEAAAVTSAPMVALWRADTDAGSLRVEAINREVADNHVSLVTLAFGQGGVGWVAVERTPLAVDDVSADSRFVGRDWWRSQDLASFFGLPVLFDDRLLGVLALNSPRPLQLGIEAREQLDTLVEEMRFSEALFHEQRALWTDDAPSDPRFANSLFARFPHRSALVIPLVVDEETSGGFYLVWWDQRRQLEREEVEMLEVIGGQVGVLLRNARLREALEHRTARLRELVHINHVLSSSLDRLTILTEIARAAARLTGAPSAVFWIADPVHRRLEVGGFSNDEVAHDFPIQTLAF